MRCDPFQRTAPPRERLLAEDAVGDVEEAGEPSSGGPKTLPRSSAQGGILPNRAGQVANDSSTRLDRLGKGTFQRSSGRLIIV